MEHKHCRLKGLYIFQIFTNNLVKFNLTLPLLVLIASLVVYHSELRIIFLRGIHQLANCNKEEHIVILFKFLVKLKIYICSSVS